MKRVVTCVFVLGFVALLASMLPQAVVAADAPADRVVVMYFHRIPGCPTCLKMRRLLRGGRQGRVCQANQGRQGRVTLH